MTTKDTGNTREETIEEVLARIRKDKKNLEGNFDEYITYKDLVEKDVIELMGFTTLPEEKKAEMHKKIEGMLENRVAIKILDALSDQDRKEYEELINAGKNEEGYKFLQDKEIDPLEVITIESILLKVELYLDSKVVRDKAQKKFDQTMNKEEKKDNAS